MAMTSIRIDTDVYRELERRAQGFADTPNTVLRRLLGLDGSLIRDADARLLYHPGRRRGFRRGRPRAERPTTTAQRDFALPILRALAQAGGEARTRDVLDAVERALSPEFQAADWERMSNGEPRWKVSAGFERKSLVERGLLDETAPRGVWRLTEAGRRYLADVDRPGGPRGWDLTFGLNVIEEVARENRQWLQEMANR